MSSPVALKQGAAERLRNIQAKLEALHSEMARHEQAIADLRAQLPDLEFEAAAMQYIVESQPAVAPVVPSVAKRKLSRPDLVALIKEHMARRGQPVEVGGLHAYLDEEAQIDLGANARNYLCGVLSRNKDTQFVNLGKGAWWLAGHPVP